MNKKAPHTIEVLLVEDDPNDMQYIRNLLTGSSTLNFDLQCVQSLADSIEQLSRKRFGVVLLDLSLPDSKGVHVFEELKDSFPTVPVIALTEHADENLAMQVARAGAQDCLYKDTLDSHVLTRAIGYAIERRQIRSKLERRVELEHMLAKISQRAMEEEDINEFQDNTLCMLGEMMDVSRAFIFQCDADSDKMINTFAWTAPGIEPQKEKLKGMEIKVFPHWKDLLQSNEVINCPDVSKLPEQSDRDFMEEHGIKSLLGLPLHISGRLYGFIGFDECRYNREWLEEDVILLCTAARIISNALERNVTVRTLSKTAKTLETIIQTSPMAIIAIDLNLNVQLWNSAAESIFGWSEEEVIGHPIPFLRADCKDQFQACISRLMVGEVVYLQRQKRARKDGSLVDVDVGATLIRAHNGEPTGFLAMLGDATERVQLEAQLRHSQKLEAIGTFAGGIAHDFRNLLMGILGYAEMLQFNLGIDHPESPLLNDLISCVDRASKLTSQLLGFSSKQCIKTKPTDLNRMVNSVKPLLETFLGEHISISWKLSQKTPVINVDTGQIEQVLINLAINARDAMPDGGELQISTGSCTFKSLSEDDSMSLNEYAVISFTDTGVGINDTIKERIFEPFFSTKSCDERSGLGLAVAYEIVKQHRGDILVDSKPGKGSTFRVLIPVADAGIDVQIDDDQRISSNGSGTILLVEDDDVVRQTTGAILENCGYKVITASDGREALSMIKEKACEIDLGIFDLIMPGISGLRVWQAVQKANPQTKALFITGHSPDMLSEKLSPPPGIPLLSKPFSFAGLTRCIREILN